MKYSYQDFISSLCIFALLNFSMKLVQIDFGTHEYITSVSGYASTYVNALKLVTNEREYGWFGREEGSYFEFTPPTKYGMILGFHGRSGNLIDAIGVYIAPRRPQPAGPWGGPGGGTWTVNGNGIGIIKQIVISSGSNSQSFSLKFKLEVDGTTQYSQDFGASGSSSQQVFLLTNEILATYWIPVLIAKVCNICRLILIHLESTLLA